MKRYFCDNCKSELIVKSWKFRFKIYQTFVGSDQSTGLINELNNNFNRNEEICEKCADKIKERINSL